MNTKNILGVVLAVGVIGFLFFAQSRLSHEIKTSPTDFKNGTYLIEGTAVTLTNGIQEVPVAPGSASKIVTRYFGNAVQGDFNGDGRDDTAFLLTQETGGSGTFYYVVVALNTPTGYQGTNAILIGDRIAPQTTNLVEGGSFVVNYATRLPNEPMTVRPSLGVSRYFHVEGTTLVEEINKNTDTAPAPKPTPLPPQTTEPIACTMDARVCPDGSYVGRTGPKCEFAPCPGN